MKKFMRDIPPWLTAGILIAVQVVNFSVSQKPAVLTFALMALLVGMIILFTVNTVLDQKELKQKTKDSTLS